MPRQQSIGILAAMLLALTVIGGHASARDEPKGPGAEVTIKGNVLCNRATDRKP